jgi:hypothetical protein
MPRRSWQYARSGVDLALYLDPPELIILLYRISHACQWSDSPYTYHMVPEDRQQWPELPEGEQRALLTITLVSTETGIIEALRGVTMSPEMTRELHNAIRRQAEAQWSQYDSKLKTTYARYTSRQLLERAVCQCRGGQ